MRKRWSCLSEMAGRVATHRWQFGKENEDQGGKIERKQPPIVLGVMSRHQKPASAHSPLVKTHNPIGTLVNHFLAGVYCAPESICSHKVNSSKAPAEVMLPVNES